MQKTSQACIHASKSQLQRSSLPEAQQEQFLEAINRLSRMRLRADQVYIRSMYLCSDKLCRQDWGRFSPEALHQICRLVVGQSVIVGHDRSRLPIARFFEAEVVRREDDPVDDEGRPVHWVRAWFYWLRETSGAKDLLLNIDGGIYREASISWRYRRARCSVCQGLIQECPHVPGRMYDGCQCTFLIEEVEEVLEGSIVYKGAESKTRFEGRSARADEHPGARLEKVSETPEAWACEPLERIARRLALQSRAIRSLLAVTDCPAEMIGLFRLAKAAGLRLAVRLLGDRDSIGARGIDRWDQEETDSGLSNWDLLWVSLRDRQTLDSRQDWWKRLTRRVRFCIWEEKGDSPPEKIGKRLIGEIFVSPPWQLQRAAEGDVDSVIELVKESI